MDSIVIDLDDLQSVRIKNTATDEALFSLDLLCDVLCIEKHPTWIEPLRSNDDHFGFTGWTYDEITISIEGVRFVLQHAATHVSNLQEVTECLNDIDNVYIGPESDDEESDTIHQLLDTIKELKEENQRLRTTLEIIQKNVC